MEGLAQANAVLTRLNSAVMAHLAYMTVTMNTMEAELKTLASEKPTKKVQKGSTTAGVAGATTLTGSKPAHQRKWKTKRKGTTRK